jgi:hypothetical protein
LRHHEVHATQVTAWKTELLENAGAIFGGDVLAADGKERIRDLQAKIGELTMENSFLKARSGNSPVRAESDDSAGWPPPRTISTRSLHEILVPFIVLEVKLCVISRRAHRRTLRTP